MTGVEAPAAMRVSVMRAPGEVVVEQRPVPSPRAGEVLVRVAAVGVCGSDVHYYRHGGIGAHAVTDPLVLGHELSGVVVAVGEGVPLERVGDRVAVEPQTPCHRCHECLAGRYNLCLDMRFYATPPVDGAFAEFVVIGSIFAHAIPDTMTDEAAALLEPLSVGIATMRKAGVMPGSRVLIAGAGPIGIICAQVARAFGASEVIVTDLVSARRERALAFSATRVIDPAEVDVAELTPAVHAFIDASGAPRAVYDGIRAVGPAGRAVLVGLGVPDMTLPVEHIQNKEVVVTGVFRYADTWPLAIQLVASGQVDLDSLVSATFGLDDVAAALDADGDPELLKAVVRPGR